MRDTKRLRFDLTNRSHHDLLESHLHKLSRAVKVSATSRKNRQMHGKLKTRSCKFGPILCLVSCLTFLFIIKLFRIRRKIFSIGFLARVHSIPAPKKEIGKSSDWSSVFYGFAHVMYQSNRSLNIPPPGIWIFWKFLFKFPSSEAEKLFKCPIIGPFQVIKCPHPRETFQ